MGTADIRTNGFDKRYELNVSTFQLVILLLFNDAETLTYGEILSATKIPTTEVKKNLLALTVKSKTHEKLLVRNPEKTLDANTTFTVSNDFKSKLLKVKIVPVVLKESKEQVKETQEKVDEERKWQLDATIVRIMKARKTLEHRDLVVDVTKQLQQRFMPAPDLIKKRIESLIEREVCFMFHLIVNNSSTLKEMLHQEANIITLLKYIKYFKVMLSYFTSYQFCPCELQFLGAASNHCSLSGIGQSLQLNLNCRKVYGNMCHQGHPRGCCMER
jgi:hypothetical protein